MRAGVAPDHPKIKSVTRMYDKTAQHPDFRFFGGVELGADVTPEDLLERYHAVVYAVGTPTDNRLGIPGDDRPGPSPPPNSSPGTTATPRTPTRRSTCRARAPW